MSIEKQLNEMFGGKPLPPVNSKRLPRSPIDLEHLRQKQAVTDQWCRHLQTEVINMIDSRHDHVIEVKVCSKCGKELTN